MGALGSVAAWVAEMEVAVRNRALKRGSRGMGATYVRAGRGGRGGFSVYDGLGPPL